MPTPEDDARAVRDFFREGYQASETRLSSARDFWRALDPTEPNWTDGEARECQWIFRGQADAVWNLLPCAWRTTGAHADLYRRLRDGVQAGQPGHVFDPFDLHVLAERALLGEFIRVAARVGYPLPPDTPEARSFGPDSRHEVAALAQHFRLPTGLLDFTRDPFVALFWALDEEGPGAAGDLAVWAIKLGALNGAAEPLDHVRSRNQNLLAQDGLVLRISMADHFRRDRGRFPALEECCRLSRDAIVKLVVSRREAPELRRFLEIRGMTKARLTPSLYGVTETVLGRYRT